jgi:two-component system OmpR family sensor kinase
MPDRADEPDSRRSLPASGPVRRHSTAVRLAALQAAILAVILSASVLGLERTFTGQSNTTTTHLLTAEVDSFRQAANHRPANETLRAFSRGYLRGHALPDGQAILIGFPGQASLGSAESGTLAHASAVAAALAHPPASSIEQTVSAGGTTYRLLAVPIAAGPIRATFIVAADQRATEQNESRVLRLAMVEALVALVAGALAGYLLLRGLLGRIQRVTEAAARLGRGDLDRRLAEQERDDEVGQLAATFDAMADRVTAAIAAQRRLLADVSHQLRTPLTVARGQLEVLGRTGQPMAADVNDTISLVIDEIDHMTAQVEGLLLLGRAMEPDFAAPQPVDLRSLINDVYDAARVLAERDWHRGGLPDLTLLANLDALRGALLNLVDNAVKATGSGEAIEIGAVVREGGWVALSVGDAGPGIPSDQRLAVLDRFSRPGAADSRGSGLGLAIVNAVAQAHGGRVEITESPLGGALVSVLLPPTVVVSGGDG